MTKLQIEGKTLSKIHTTSEGVLFQTTDGSKYLMHHHQSCCEQVDIEDVVGDMNDLIGLPILIAEEREENDPQQECARWTFYTFSTIKGSVDFRWYGSSNGYYSVGVSFELVR